MKKKFTLLIASLAFVATLSAQVKIGNNSATVNTNSLLELESTSQGLLLPCVAFQYCILCSINSSYCRNDRLQHEAAAGTGSTAVLAGYYYNDGAQRVQILNQANTLTLLPWFNAVTNTAATANTQNIYQSGNEGILTGTTAPTAALDVNDTTRFRNLPTGLSTDNLVAADANGNLQFLAAIKPSIMVIGLPTAGVLTTRGTAGGAYQFTTATAILNTITGATYSAGSITLYRYGTDQQLFLRFSKWCRWKRKNI